MYSVHVSRTRLGLGAAALGLMGGLAVFIAANSAVLLAGGAAVGVIAVYALGKPAHSLELSLAGDARAGFIELHREVARSRRTNRPFSLVSLAGGVETGRSLRRHLRLPDYLWVDDDAVHVLLPESDRRQAHAFIERLGAIGDHAPSVLSVASFPEDAITIGGLIGAAEAGYYSRPPDPCPA